MTRKQNFAVKKCSGIVKEYRSTELVSLALDLQKRYQHDHERSYSDPIIFARMDPSSKGSGPFRGYKLSHISHLLASTIQLGLRRCFSFLLHLVSTQWEYRICSRSHYDPRRMKDRYAEGD